MHLLNRTLLVLTLSMRMIMLNQKCNANSESINWYFRIFLYPLKYYSIIKITRIYGIKEIMFTESKKTYSKTLSLSRSLAFDGFPLKPMPLIISNPLSAMKNALKSFSSMILYTCNLNRQTRTFHEWVNE